MPEIKIEGIEGMTADKSNDNDIFDAQMQNFGDSLLRIRFPNHNQ